MSFSVNVWADELTAAQTGGLSHQEVIGVAKRKAKAMGAYEALHPEEYQTWAKPSACGHGYTVEWVKKP